MSLIQFVFFPLPLYSERCLVGVVAPSKMALSKKSMVDSV